MTNGMSLEVQVANSARVWRESSHGAGMAANEFRNRKFAGSLERWIAELLSTDGLASFDVRIAHSKPYASRNTDQEWSFQFVRSG